MELKNVREKNIIIDYIPVLVLTPINDSDLHPTIVFYHGWGSSIEKQRFRGFILASLGYQVVIPCSIYHGDRNPVDHTKAENAGKYFWEVIFSNIEDFKKIFEYTVSRLSTNPNRIGVCGNSMGGFTSAGIFSYYPNIKAAVIFNGSCNWDYSNKCFLEALSLNSDDIPKEVQDKIDKYNPMNNIESIKDRPILMLHGDSDSLVDVGAQREFFNESSSLLEYSDNICYIEYPKLNHFVTTNMMEEAANWFYKYL
ncbi:hypothetical protein E9840_03200 [Tissierella creatinini]|nr:hypothetical protein E9840_03200 [Tissierella creatinini]TJX66151.1 hypothetical protein E8P77_08780 [Soehngenia saccharolytica]